MPWDHSDASLVMPGLSRASTTLLAAKQDVDARDKPGA